MPAKYIYVEEELLLEMKSDFSGLTQEVKVIKDLLLKNRPTAQENHDELMDTADLRAHLKVSSKTLYIYRRNGLPFIQDGPKGKIFYRRSEVDIYINSLSKKL